MGALRLILVPVVLVCLQTPLLAQRASVAASGVYATLNGDDYARFDAGLGFDGQVRYQPRGPFSVGIGFQYSSHKIQQASESFHASGPFVDARYTFAIRSAPKVHPYLGGRFALIHWVVPNIEASANGQAYGPVGGLMIQVGNATRLDLGLAFLSLHIGDATSFGSTVPNSSTSGSALALRLGFDVGFGQ